MKANELMIGDWVQDITPVVIDAISNEDICTYRDENGYITANPSNLKPIPLTAKILEKNGFDSRYSTYHKHHHYRIHTKGHLLHIWEKDGVFKWHIGEARTTLEIQYVHQLQHILNLMGSDRYIAL